MSAVALVGATAPRVSREISASSDVSLVSGDEVLLEPATRAVLVTKLAPTPAEGINAGWFTTLSSRQALASVEFAEVKCYVDVAGAASTVNNAVIGSGGLPCSLGNTIVGYFGVVLRAKMECLETPVGGESNIVLAQRAESNLSAGDLAGGSGAILGADWSAGTVAYGRDPRLIYETERTLYLRQNGAGAGTYSAGKFLITFYCRYTL